MTQHQGWRGRVNRGVKEAISIHDLDTSPPMDKMSCRLVEGGGGG